MYSVPGEGRWFVPAHMDVGRTTSHGDGMLPPVIIERVEEMAMGNLRRIQTVQTPTV